MASYIEFTFDHSNELVELLIEHIELVLQTLVFALPLGILLGVFIAYYQPAAVTVLWGAGVAMTIPSLALFGLLIPILGIGNPPVIVALVLYAQLPIIRNTYIGLTSVDQSIIEAGRGVGMTKWQRLYKLQIPIALPVMIAGIRNAIVILIGVATVGAYVGAGGLGFYIFTGIYQANVEMVVVTTIVVSLLALVFDYGFKSIEQILQLRNGEEIPLTWGAKLLTRALP
ncbi:ABC-type proline/glycine betaine transport system, permease component [Halalkaliarchaeum desulfuricum]|uniref:ABC-type proline/glycine betaine transport system, permease component n=1 Tax=Halalkaliarchaeum desulfuricum TaxID=2055893 RepID=A0A343TL68_9EURY|nr:ABC transporter permease [Halalkaliarchaeum desulfuricum]AUX09840.1 ABC-type proline/glycine betaine transport system, permease component [Halalkaliarchaeum desulfuricum]